MAKIRCQYSATQYDNHDLTATVEETVKLLNTSKDQYVPFQLLEGGDVRYFSRNMITMVYTGESDSPSAQTSGTDSMALPQE